MKRVATVLLTKEQILVGIRKLAKKLNKKFKGKNPLMLGIINGVIPFYAALSLNLTFDHEYDFIKCESYAGTKQSQIVNVLWQKRRSLKGKDVILLDDIFDTGKTILATVKLLKAEGAKTVTTVTLVDKAKAHPKNIEPDYSCFKIPNVWVVGFGLDTAGLMRNLPCIGVLRKDLQDKYK